MTEFLPAEIHTSLKRLDLILKTPYSVPEIPKLLNDTVLLGGKRLRPALCFLMGEVLSIEPTKMTPLARAAEFTHSASLAHDDVLDNATTRRNRKTINMESSNSRAVLAGDLLLARVMVEISEIRNVEIIHDLALVVEDLVNGEWLQLEAKMNMDVTTDYLLEISRRKTASLMGWCCSSAARLSDSKNVELFEAAQRFGRSVGIAFQLIDDVIDFDPNTEKTYAKDLREGLINFVTADLLHHNHELKQPIAQILGVEDPEEFPWTDEQIHESQKRIRDHAQLFLKDATTSLKVIETYKSSNASADSCFQSLQGLIQFLGAREL